MQPAELDAGAPGDPVDEGALEEAPRHGRNKEYRAREIFEILEQPPQTY